MLIDYKLGQGSIVLRVKILNSSVSTGAGLTGLTSASAGLIISTIADNEATATTYTVAGSTIESITTLGTYAAPTATKCRFKEVDATNHKGVYEIQIADARFAVSNAKSLLISILGATNAAETDCVIPLRSIDPYDAVRFGMTALPNVVSGNTGAIITHGTGTAQLKCTSGYVSPTWADIGSPTTTVNLSNTTIATSQTIATVTNQLTAAQIATGVWQDTTAGDFTVASSIGKSLYTSGVVPGGSGGLFIAGTNAATTVTTSFTTTFTGNLTGSVASVTGAVGSVTGAVGSVTGNVGGNVVGSVGSVTGAVGSVTGNVGGNVTGSVGSVTGNVGGNVVGTIGGFTAAAKAEIEVEVNDGLVAQRLDELLNADSDIDGAAPPTVGSVFHELMSKTDLSFTFSQATDSLEALRDRGDAAWITAVGFSTHSAADVWAVTTRILTAATNITSTGGTTVPQTGDSFARIGATGSGLTSLAQASVATEARLAELDAANIPADVDQIKADLPSRVTKNTALANFEFLMLLASDHVTGATGKTITATRSIDGGAFAACTNAATEVSNGMYKIDLAAADLNGNVITLRFTATACDDRFITIVTQP